MPVTVDILDKEYVISCPPSEKDALLESARLLSDRMRAVRDGGKVLGSERVAVITALNIIHELERERRDQHSRTSELADGIERLEEKVRLAVGRRAAGETVD